MIRILAATDVNTRHFHNSVMALALVIYETSEEMSVFYLVIVVANSAYSAAVKYAVFWGNCGL